jgi:transposase
MNKLDARSLPESSLELLRQQAHRLRLQGRTLAEVASIVGVHLATVKKWSRVFHIGSNDMSGVSSARRGRRFGEGRTLNFGDELVLRDLIIGSSPSQLSLPFSLWTRKAVQDAIKTKFGIDMPIRTVGEYLHRWGFTPQRAAKQAIEQRPAQLEQWVDVDYPGVVKRAKAERAEIYWGDETAIRQDTAWVRGYAPIGHTPVIAHRARWDSITMISALNNQGLVRFAFHDGAINGERFLQFLQGMTQDIQCKVYLVVDNLRVHHARKVREWLDEHKDQIELVYLPPYSPQANPDEILNRDMKTELRLRPAAKDAKSLKEIAVGFMNALVKTPGRIARYFLSQHVAYAGVRCEESTV